MVNFPQATRHWWLGWPDPQKFL